MPPIAACADPAHITVTKVISCDPFNPGSGGSSATLTAGDPVIFAIAVRNGGGATAAVRIDDVIDPVFDGPAWTRTGPTGVVTTGSGSITGDHDNLDAGQQITYLIEATYQPEWCTSLTVQTVSVTLDTKGCCGADKIYAWAKVTNGTPGAPKVKIDPTQGTIAVEVLTYLIEAIPFEDKVTLADFINSCGTIADLIRGGGGAGDGVAVPILDAFGAPTGLYGETSPGV